MPRTFTIEDGEITLSLKLKTSMKKIKTLFVLCMNKKLTKDLEEDL